MLVLSRKTSERIKIGEDIVITIVRIGPAAVRVGIDAPQELLIVREELTAADTATQPPTPARRASEGQGEPTRAAG